RVNLEGATMSEGFSLSRYLNDFFLVMGEEWVFYLLLALSVISVFVMIERLRALSRECDDLESLTARIRRAARGGDAERELRGFSGVAARVAREGLRERRRGPAAAEEAMDA